MKYIIKISDLFKKFPKDLVIILTIYFTANFLILLNHGIYWDDWALYGHDKDTTYNWLSSTGVIGLAQFHYLLLSLNSVFIYHLIVFFCFLFSAIYFYYILKEISEVDSHSRIFIVIFFLLFPVNNARIALSTTQYAVCYFIFYLSFWLLAQYLTRPQIFRRIVILITFAFSFSMNSLLVFYLLPIAFIFYKNKVTSFEKLKYVVLNYADFLTLPLAYWMLKIILYRQSGLYSDYNEITLKNFVYLPIGFLHSIYTSFLNIIDMSFVNFSIAFVLSGGIIIFLILNKYVDRNNNDKYFNYLLLFGVIGYLLGVLPYLLVRKLPYFWDWGSRHQILIPLGASFVITYAVKIFFRSLKLRIEFVNFVFSVLIFAFVLLNIKIWIDYQKDWYKQLSMMQNMKVSKILKENTTFLFKDNELSLNALKRTYRTYEYTGMLRNVFNVETKFGEDSLIYSQNGMSYYKVFIPHKQYNMVDYKPKNIDYFVTINKGAIDLDIRNTFELLYLESFNSKKFQEKIKNIVSFSYFKYCLE